MLEFSCWATVGDTYIVLLKIIGIIGNKYGVDSCLRERLVRMHHYCDQEEHFNAVRELYNAYPFCVGVEFERCEVPPSLSGYREIFTTFENTTDQKYTKFVPFPELKFTDVSRLELPKRYTSVMVKAGRKAQHREFSSKTIQEIVEWSIDPVVLLGVDDRIFADICFKPDKVRYLMNLTGYLETCEIIKGSSHHFGCPGASCLVAMSHKVPTTILCMSDQEKRAIEIRTTLEWKPYQFIFDKEIKWEK
jgi:hypothetical protein